MADKNINTDGGKGSASEGVNLDAILGAGGIDKEDQAQYQEGMGSLFEEGNYDFIGQIAQILTEVMEDISAEEELLQDAVANEEKVEEDHASDGGNASKGAAHVEHTETLDMNNIMGRGAGGAASEDGASDAASSDAANDTGSYVDAFVIDDSAANTEGGMFAGFGSMEGGLAAHDVGGAFEEMGSEGRDFDKSDFVSQDSGSIDLSSIAKMMHSGGWMQNPMAMREAMQEMQNNPELQELMDDISGIGGDVAAFLLLSHIVEVGSGGGADGSADYTYSTTTYEDGTVVFTDSTGYELITYPDGSSESSSPDGSWSTYDAATGRFEDSDGNWSIYNADTGGIITYDAATGVTVTFSSSDDVEGVATYPDGSTSTAAEYRNSPEFQEAMEASMPGGPVGGGEYSDDGGGEIEGLGYEDPDSYLSEDSGQAVDCGIGECNMDYAYSADAEGEWSHEAPPLMESNEVHETSFDNTDYYHDTAFDDAEHAVPGDYSSSNTYECNTGMDMGLSADMSVSDSLDMASMSANSGVVIVDTSLTMPEPVGLDDGWEHAPSATELFGEVPILTSLNDEGDEGEHLVEDAELIVNAEDVAGAGGGSDSSAFDDASVDSNAII